MKKLFRQSRPHHFLSIAALAPLVDIFTILVVAVLQSSSSQAPPEFPENSVELPISAQNHQVQQPATIDIAKDGIYLNGSRVSSRAFWEQQKQPIITDLYERLLMKVPSKIQIRADAGVPWKLIDKTLATTRQAGCLDVTLLAISKDSL